ncbi:hypothetical protein [Nocardioides convexus]|uniref:hypothetical protein n=1 Tax=Nocardioides convexus TaxID=2712224 RepID=UPI002418A75B|nr:hypothetical protein [Nocardioides convexus]
MARVALVLGSGGARGYAHLGAVEEVRARGARGRRGVRYVDGGRRRGPGRRREGRGVQRLGGDAHPTPRGPAGRPDLGRRRSGERGAADGEPRRAWSAR